MLLVLSATLVIFRLGSSTSTSVEASGAELVTPSTSKWVVATLVITTPSCTNIMFDTTTGISSVMLDGTLNAVGASVNTPVPAPQLPPVMPPEVAATVGVPKCSPSGSESEMVTLVNVPPK